MLSLLVRISSPKKLPVCDVWNLTPSAACLIRKLSYDRIDTSRILPADFVTSQGKRVTIDIGKLDDVEECCAFGETFFRERPISLLLSNSALKKLAFIKPWTVGCLKSNISLVARNEHGSIVGVRMSDLSTIENPVQTPKEVTDSDAMGAVLAKLNEGFDVFKMCQTNTIFRFVYLGVHKDYRNQGLAEKMFEISIELAKMKGAGAIVVEGVNKYATKAAIKSGFKVVNTVTMSSLKESIPSQHFLPLVTDNPEACLLVRALP